MNINDAAFLYLPPHPQGDLTSDGSSSEFQQLLAQFGDRDSRDASQAAAIRPNIGSHAQRFEDRPMVVLASVDFEEAKLTSASVQSGVDSVSTEVENRIDRLLSRLEERRTTNRMEVGARIGFGSIPDRFERIPRTAGLGQILGAPASNGSNNAATTGPHVQSPSLGHRSPGSIAVTQGSAGSQTSKSSDRTGQPSPFSALLMAEEDGLRLIVRTPALPTAEKERLEMRIARLFSQRGMQIPETIIHSADSPSSREDS